MRAAVDEVTRGLTTTSDKIRALARAGYLRTEISKLLDIRYQHVRKVLVDAGIESGLQRTVELERSSEVIEAPEAEFEPTPPSTLLEAGFAWIGEWQVADGTLGLDGRAPSAAGVYAFIPGRRDRLCRRDTERPSNAHGPVPPGTYGAKNQLPRERPYQTGPCGGAAGAGDVRPSGSFRMERSSGRRRRRARGRSHPPHSTTMEQAGAVVNQLAPSPSLCPR